MFGDCDGLVMIKCIGYYLVDYELVLFELVVGKICIMFDVFIMVLGYDVIDVFCMYFCLFLGLGMLDVYWFWLNKVLKILVL